MLNPTGSSLSSRRLVVRVGRDMHEVAVHDFTSFVAIRILPRPARCASPAVPRGMGQIQRVKMAMKSRGLPDSQRLGP
jgi:hypothetical protein